MRTWAFTVIIEDNGVLLLTGGVAPVVTMDNYFKEAQNLISVHSRYSWLLSKMTVKPQIILLCGEVI